MESVLDVLTKPRIIETFEGVICSSIWLVSPCRALEELETSFLDPVEFTDRFYIYVISKFTILGGVKL